ncbi:MAG: DUF3987 domain-containing protein [Rhodospirillales bacterium]|nr:DUF3987 domain-containing protein [Rhodospirillales bacterium]MCB9994871.1 DUF3987 domain-containing protein [Rhodospirillales bacterium]
MIANLNDSDIMTIEEVTAEKPQPLTRPLDPADPFPVEALGPILEPAARAIQDRTLAPMALCAQSVLATATLVVQGFKDVELPTGQRKPPSCFFLSIAGTGERKTACDMLALKPVHRYESEKRLEYNEQERIWANKHEIYEKLRGDIKKDNRKYPTASSKEKAMEALGKPPKAPHIPVLTCKDATIEGLIVFCTRAQPSIGLFNGEGGQFIGGHGMSDEAKIRTSTALSHFWDGTPVDRLRATDGYVYLSGRRLSMHLMAQPDIAAEMLSDRTLLDQGLLSRFLVTAPDSTAGTRFFKEPDHESAAVLKAYEDRLYSLLIKPLPVEEEDEDVLKPGILQLCEEARTLWISYTNAVERQLCKDGPLEHVRGLANKIPEHAARLAAVLTLVEDPQAQFISRDAMENGIKLAEHYMAEAIRLFSAQRVRTQLRIAEDALKWMREEWGHDVISLPDLYQLGPNRIRDKTSALTVVRILEDHGWLVEIPDGAEVAGTRRREAWHIVDEEI